MVAIPASPPLRVCPCETATGSLFGRRPHARFCSKLCQSRHWRSSYRLEFPIPKPARTCPHCQREFAQLRSDQAYCSAKCRGLAQGNRSRRKTNAPTDHAIACCPVCSKIYEKRRFNQRYCSKPCLWFALNQRRIDKRGRTSNRNHWPSPALISRRIQAIQQQRERDGQAHKQRQRETRPQDEQASLHANADPNSDRVCSHSSVLDG